MIWKVWNMFGGLNNSVRIAINDILNPDGKDNEKLYDILTFDILEKDKHGNTNIVLDLTQDFEKLKVILSKFPKPDIITGSPMCNAFSQARRLPNGNHCFVKDDNGTMLLRTKESLLYEDGRNKRNGITNYDKMVVTRTNGMKAITNLIRIIEYFKPKYFYIENPKNSMMWDYIRQTLTSSTFNIDDLYLNSTYYGNYGSVYVKPTTFLSNINLELNTNTKRKLMFNNTVGVSIDNISKKDRSDIPTKLLQAIFKKFEEHEKANNK